LGINAGGLVLGLTAIVCLSEREMLWFSVAGSLLSFFLLCFWGALRRKVYCARNVEKDTRPRLKQTHQIN